MHDKKPYAPFKAVLRLEIATIIALGLFVGSGATAKEGFSTLVQDAPPAVQSSWNKTFTVLTEYPDRYGIGTAFLIGKKGSHLYFLTVSHAVRESCNGGPCPET